MPTARTSSQRFPDQPDFVGRLIRDAFNRLTAEVTARLAVSHPEATAASNRVMVLIDPNGTRPAELARRSQVTRQSMSETLAGMQAVGLIELRADPDDRRAKRVVLTPTGWQGMRDGLQVALEIHRRWETILGKEKMAALMTLMTELLDKLDALDRSQDASTR